MRTPPLSSRLAPVLTLLVLSGCNSAYREAFARAKEAAIRGDFLTAARGYRDACRAAPDDEDACTRMPLFAVKATDQALTSARPACAAGDLDRCLPPLLDARDVQPEHAEVNALLAQASQLHTERCEGQWKDDGQMGTAVAGFACLQSRGHQLPVASFQDLLVARAGQLSSRFATLATQAHAQGTAGAEAVLWNTARCLAPAEATNAQSQRSSQDFFIQSAIPVAAELGGRIPPPVAHGLASPCMSLSSGLPRWARCAETGSVPGQPEPLQIRVDALIQRTVETVTENIDRVRYVSGKRQVRNPRYGEARERVSHAEHDLREAEKAAKDKQAECDKASTTHDATCVGCAKTPPATSTACDEAKRFAEARERRARERLDVGRELDATPEFLTEDVYDTFTYSIFTHNWSSPFQFTLETSTAGMQPPVRQAGELRFADAEHVGFQPAGLTADPLDVPPPQAYSQAFLSQLAPHVFAAVQRDAQVRGAARRAACASLPADWSTSWVQCWAEAALWESGNEPAPNEFLRVLASSKGAPQQPQCR
jgi:hypothetical protein